MANIKFAYTFQMGQTNQKPATVKFIKLQRSQEHMYKSAMHLKWKEL